MAHIGKIYELAFRRDVAMNVQNVNAWPNRMRWQNSVGDNSLPPGNQIMPPVDSNAAVMFNGWGISWTSPPFVFSTVTCHWYCECDQPWWPGHNSTMTNRLYDATQIIYESSRVYNGQPHYGGLDAHGFPTIDLMATLYGWGTIFHMGFVDPVLW